MTSDHLILALDVPTKEEALKWVDRMTGRIGTFKVGLQLFTACGPDLVREVKARGGRIFLDLKLHDIPNTVSKAIESVGPLGLSFLTIHTLGGRAMMEAAVKSAAQFPGLNILGVTILTHHSEQELSELGFDHSVPGQVMLLARLAKSSGLNGLVCSPLEVPLIRRELKEICLVTPGVRLGGVGSVSGDDQTRVMTPQEAIAAGSTHLVLGRPILQAENPEQVVDSLLAS
jgi:orotidine-5'-phosphate decarboxylase